MTSLGFKKLPVSKIGSIHPCIVFYESELSWAGDPVDYFWHVEINLGPMNGIRIHGTRHDSISIMKHRDIRHNEEDYYIMPSFPLERATKSIRKPRIWEMTEEYTQKIVTRLT